MMKVLNDLIILILKNWKIFNFILKKHNLQFKLRELNSKNPYNQNWCCNVDKQQWILAFSSII